MSLAILGSGAFGTALASVFAANGQDVWLWSRSAHQTKLLARTRENPLLPGVKIDDRITPTSDIDDIANADIVLLSVPAQQTGVLLDKHASHIPDVPVLLCAKGIDLNSFHTQSEIASDHLPNHQIAILTGPGFAAEIAHGKPTALTLACTDVQAGEALQSSLSTEKVRLYLTTDIVGAQLGGALKNVIAIAAGIVTGARLGESARAALLTRGFAEMRRLGTAMGGMDETFAGLSGLGDLVLTASSEQSRNFAQGLQLGRGGGRSEGVTVEGIATATAACKLASEYGIDMPITRAVSDVLSGQTSIEQAMATLLSRPLKQE